MGALPAGVIGRRFARRARGFILAGAIIGAAAPPRPAAGQVAPVTHAVFRDSVRLGEATVGIVGWQGVGVLLVLRVGASSWPAILTPPGAERWIPATGRALAEYLDGLPGASPWSARRVVRGREAEDGLYLGPVSREASGPAALAFVVKDVEFGRGLVIPLGSGEAEGLLRMVAAAHEASGGGDGSPSASTCGPPDTVAGERPSFPFATLGGDRVGQVVVAFRIMASGDVDAASATVLYSSAAVLERAVLRWFAKARYAPGRSPSGSPCDAIGAQSFVFGYDGEGMPGAGLTWVRRTP